MGKRSARMEEERQEQAYDQGWQQASASQAPAAQAPAAPAAGPPPSGGITAEDTQRLEELGRLHDQGILTDEEFSAQKAKILGMG